MAIAKAGSTVTPATRMLTAMPDCFARLTFTGHGILNALLIARLVTVATKTTIAVQKITAGTPQKRKKRKNSELALRCGHVRLALSSAGKWRVQFPPVTTMNRMVNSVTLGSRFHIKAV
jgi:hypothetical protein